MTVSEPLSARSQHALTLLALGSFALAVFAEAWALLARQAPDASWHVGGYPSAIDRLALAAWIEAVVLVALALALASMRTMRFPRTMARALVPALVLGTVLSMSALGYSAATGIHGYQLAGASGAARTVLVMRLLGDALRLGALALALHTWRSARSATTAGHPTT